MSRLLTDAEIGALLAEQKKLPERWRSRLELRPKGEFKYEHRDLDVQGANGSTFKIVLRQNTENRLDFSIILMFIDRDGNEYRLCRYNGNSHKHTNKMEKSQGRNDASFLARFHIHTATERYQQQGLEIDGYAEVTNQYSSFETALKEFLQANCFVLPEEHLPLFDNHGGAK